MDVLQLAKEVSQEVIKWRRDLHQIPEVGLQLPQTAKYVADRLEEMGIEYRENVGGISGIVGLIRGGQEGKTIALRADMDALPVKEETGLDFASTNGNMHACGHDAHTAILLGAAKILSEHKDKLKGNVKLIFQPAEEGPGGAEPMLKDGAFETPKVDAVLGAHVGNIAPGIEKGEIYLNTGNMMACLDDFRITFKGIGSHGAYPHQGVDPVTMTSYAITSIQEILSRELEPTQPGVITVGTIHGGTAYNVIPGQVHVEGTARAVDQETREFIARRIGEIARNIANGFRGEVEYDYHFGYPPLENDKEFTEKFRASAEKVLPKEKVKMMEKPVMGGEDFAYYLGEVPGTFIFMSTPKEVDGKYYPHHNSKFDVDEDCLKTGVALFVQGAYDFFNEN